MRIHFLASKANLTTFKEHLPSKFEGVQVMGSNSFGESVNDIIRKAPVQPYDLVVIVSVQAVAEDIATRGEFSERLRDASSLSLKDTPIFFVMSKQSKEVDSLIRGFFKSSNIRIIKYDGKMHMSDIETAIKESIVIYEKQVDTPLSEGIKETVERTISSKSENGYLNKSVVMGVRLSDKLDLLSKYINSDKADSTPITLEDKANHMEKIKENIRANSDAIKNADSRATTHSGDSTLPESFITIDGVDEALDARRISEVLYSSNEDYKSLSVTMDAINGAVEDLKEDVEQTQVVLELLEEKPKVITAMRKIESEYLVEVINEITDISSNRFDTASGLVKLKVKNLEALSDNPDVKQIERLKEFRDSILKGTAESANEFVRTIETVKNSMESFGRTYINDINNVISERLQIANSRGVKLEGNTTPSKEVLQVIQDSYIQTKSSFTELKYKSETMIENFSKVIAVDNKIIDKQTQVIHDLATDNVRKVIQVGSNLEAKSLVVVGRDGSGKTAVGASLAHVYQKRGNKVLVFDLDDESPSLHLYGKDENIGYSFSVGTGNLTHKFEEGKLMAFINNGMLSDSSFRFNLDVLLGELKEREKEFDRVIFIVPETHPELYKIQQSCKSTVYITDSDISNVQRTTTLSETILHVTPLNTVLVNKCSQAIESSIKELIPLQINNIAVITGLYYSKFDYCKMKNLLPSRESGGFENTMQLVIRSIE